MVASEEIRRIVERWLIAARDNDPGAFVARMSRLPGTLMIGAAEPEWWREDVYAVCRAQINEAGGLPFAEYEIEGWEEGSIGWAAIRTRLIGPDGVSPLRLTCVLHLEQGEWKVVQAHVSGVRSNEELLGLELTMSIDQLEATVLRERPDMAGSAAADGTVTIVFTDIVDSTVLLGRLGDQAWLEVIRRHNEVITSTAAAAGGTVVETQGDGSMLAFSSARRAVACARAIQSEIGKTFADASAPIRVRIGIHTGDALVEEDHFYGATVHYAARVAGNALGGEVLVSNLVRELVGGSEVSFRESREVELKGLEGLHRLYALALEESDGS